MPPLLIISDRRQARLPLEKVAEAAFLGGCRWFSLREKDLPPAERRALLDALVTVGRRLGAVVTAHEDIEAVAATGVVIIRRSQYRLKPWSGDDPAGRLRNQSL